MTRIWHALDFNDRRVEGSVKLHIVPEELVDTVIADLKGRGFPYVQENTVIPKCGFDFPGAVHLDDVWYDFQLDGVIAQFSARSFEGMLQQLRTLQPRFSLTGRQYFKMHGFLNCLVLTSDDLIHLRAKMTLKLQEALAQAEIEARRFNELFAKDPHPNVYVEPRQVPRRRGTA